MPHHLVGHKAHWPVCVGGCVTGGPGPAHVFGEHLCALLIACHFGSRICDFVLPCLLQAHTSSSRQGCKAFLDCPHPPSQARNHGWLARDTFCNGRVFIQSWRWDPPKLSRRNPSFSQNDFGKFLRGGYPNRSSGIHRWGLDLSTGYPNTCFSWFSGYPQLTLAFSAGRRIFSDFFPEVPVTKIRVSAPAPYKNPSDTFCDLPTAFFPTLLLGVVRRGPCSLVCLHIAGQATVLACTCNIPPLLRGDQTVRDNCLTVHCQCAAVDLMVSEYGFGYGSKRWKSQFSSEEF